MPPAVPSPKPQRAVVHGAWLAVGVAVAVLAVAAAGVQQALALGTPYIGKVLAVAVAGGAGVAWLAGRALGPHAFGAANDVTLARACLVALLAGLLGETLDDALAWLAALVALVALVLDGVDGRLARAHGTESRFGARFDMETDALLGLVLALLVLQLEKAGAVVVVAGLARYAFGLTLAVLPRLDRPLPPSRRRRTVCVVQIAGLGLCLVPWLARPASSVLAVGVVGAVCMSFAADLRWLASAAAAPAVHDATPPE